MPNRGNNANRGAGRSGKGRMGGPFAAGPGGSCVCPKCGYTQAHVRGQACNQQVCPTCGTPLTRG